MSYGSTIGVVDGVKVDLRAKIAYEDADKVMRSGRNGSRKLQNHTYMKRIDEHTVGVLLHDTYVVKLHDDGSTSLDSGGWHTMTTKDRINAYLPPNVQVGSDHGIWSVYTAPIESIVRHEKKAYIDGVWTDTGTYSEYTPWDARKNVHRFFDGIRIAADGTIVNPRRAEMEAQQEREKRIRKDMNAYIAKFIKALDEGIPMPGTGDCWGCSMVTDDGKTAMGESHLLDHFEEDYFVPSLLINAYKERGFNDWQFAFAMDFDHEMLKNDEGIRLRRKWGGSDQPDNGQVAKILRKYLKSRVLPELA